MQMKLRRKKPSSFNKKMEKIFKCAKYIFLLSIIVFAMCIGGVFASWDYVTSPEENTSSLSISSLNWNIKNYLGDEIYSNSENGQKVYAQIEGNSADDKTSIFNNSTSYSQETSQRWTNYVSNNVDEGEPVKWTLTFLESIEFDEIRIHHFCDHDNCFIPLNINISYQDEDDNDISFVYASTNETYTSSNNNEFGGWGNQSSSSYSYCLDGTFTIDESESSDVSFTTNWSDAKDLYNVRTSSYGQSNTLSCFQCVIDGETKNFEYSYTGSVPYTSFYLNDKTKTITTDVIYLTLTPQEDRYVGIVELEFYKNGEEVNL